jgi:hypothetical protein
MSALITIIVQKAAKNPQRDEYQSTHAFSALSFLSFKSGVKQMKNADGAHVEKGVCLIWLHAASLMHCLCVQQKQNRCSRGVSIYLLLLCSSARFGQISMQAEILHAVTRDSEPPRLYIGACMHCLMRASIWPRANSTPERTQ